LLPAEFHTRIGSGPDGFAEQPPRTESTGQQPEAAFSKELSAEDYVKSAGET
jgi:hypothetical protein